MANNKRIIQFLPTADLLLNDLLQKLLLQIQSILTEKFIGMYIGGSIAKNSFNQKTSDIDCYIVTTRILSEKIIRQIETMHKQFNSSFVN